MELILDRLRSKTTRNTTVKNYYQIWCQFNKFVIRLDQKPTTWEDRLALYGAYLVDKGTQSSTLKSYFSAIKKILEMNEYEFKMKTLLLNTERSQNTVLLASTQAVYKALHSTVQGHTQTDSQSAQFRVRAAVVVAVGSLRA